MSIFVVFPPAGYATISRNVICHNLWGVALVGIPGTHTLHCLPYENFGENHNEGPPVPSDNNHLYTVGSVPHSHTMGSR